MAIKSKREKSKNKKRQRIPKPSQKQKQKQNVKQETNVNIKIGDIKPKRKYNRKQNPKTQNDQQQQGASPSFVFNPTILTQQPSMVPVTYNPPVYEPEPKKAVSSASPPIAPPVVTPNIINMRELTEQNKMKAENLKYKRLHLSSVKEPQLNVDKIMERLNRRKKVNIDNTPFSGQVSAAFIPSEAPPLMEQIQIIKNAAALAGGSVQDVVRKYYNNEGERLPSRNEMPPSPVPATAILAGGGYETAVPLGPVRILSQDPNAVAARERRRLIKN